MRRTILFLCLFLAGCGLRPSVITGPPVKVGTKNFYGVLITTHNLFGANLKTLNTVSVDDDKGRTQVEHSTDAASPGFFKAFLPSGGVAGGQAKTIGVPGVTP
jgi:hypothetical protein